MGLSAPLAASSQATAPAPALGRGARSRRSGSGRHGAAPSEGRHGDEAGPGRSSPGVLAGRVGLAPAAHAGAIPGPLIPGYQREWTKSLPKFLESFSTRG